MVIVWSMGDQFWIDIIQVTVTLSDAAGTYSGALVPVVKVGEYIGGTITAKSTAQNDNVEAVGLVELRDSGTIAFGSEVLSVRVRVNKTAGTAGDTVVTFEVMLFMHRPSR